MGFDDAAQHDFAQSAGLEVGGHGLVPCVDHHDATRSNLGREHRVRLIGHELVRLGFDADEHAFVRSVISRIRTRLFFASRRSLASTMAAAFGATRGFATLATGLVGGGFGFLVFLAVFGGFVLHNLRVTPVGRKGFSDGGKALSHQILDRGGIRVPENRSSLGNHHLFDDESEFFPTVVSPEVRPDGITIADAPLCQPIHTHHEDEGRVAQDRVELDSSAFREFGDGTSGEGVEQVVAIGFLCIVVSPEADSNLTRNSLDLGQGFIHQDVEGPMGHLHTIDGDFPRSARQVHRQVVDELGRCEPFMPVRHEDRGERSYGRQVRVATAVDRLSDEGVVEERLPGDVKEGSVCFTIDGRDDEVLTISIVHREGER